MKSQTASTHVRANVSELLSSQLLDLLGSVESLDVGCELFVLGQELGVELSCLFDLTIRIQYLAIGHDLGHKCSTHHNE